MKFLFCICRYTLLKLVQKFGQLKKFDFLYHKFGPDKGKPRGYCFVTFGTKEVRFLCERVHNIYTDSNVAAVIQ